MPHITMPPLSIIILPNAAIRILGEVLDLTEVRWGGELLHKSYVLRIHTCT